jgi:hypothetical protein
MKKDLYQELIETIIKEKPSKKKLGALDIYAQGI